MDLKQYIRTVPDFPKPGIQFRDITSLLGNRAAFQYINQVFFERYADQNIDAVVGIESRGFIFGAVLAQLLGCAFVPVRKQGKLPHQTLQQEYSLEYGDTAIEIHRDALAKGDRIVVIDDLVATGGTLIAANKLIETLGGVIVECGAVIELPALGARDKLDQYKVFSMVRY